MEKRINIKYVLLQILYQGTNSVFYGFGVYLLMERGFTSGEAGICLSLACLINILLAPTVSNFLETNEKITLFEMALVFLGIVLILVGVNFVTTNKLIIAITYVIAMGINSNIDPFMNSLKNVFASAGCKINYLIPRACGSLSYGAVLAVLGELTDTYSYSILLVTLISLVVGVTITFLFTRKDYYEVKSKVPAQEKEETISLSQFIKNNKVYLVLSICIAGMFFGQSGTEMFLTLIVDNIGGGVDDMGKILGFKAICEATAIILFPLVLKKFKLSYILMFSALSFAIKVYIVGTATTMFQVYLGQVFQMSAFAMLLPGTLEFVSRTMNKKEMIRGTAFFTLSSGLGSVCSNLVSGNIADLYGVPTMCYLALAVTTIFSIVFIITMIVKGKKLLND